MGRGVNRSKKSRKIKKKSRKIQVNQEEIVKKSKSKKSRTDLFSSDLPLGPGHFKERNEFGSWHTLLCVQLKSDNKPARTLLIVKFKW